MPLRRTPPCTPTSPTKSSQEHEITMEQFGGSAPNLNVDESHNVNMRMKRRREEDWSTDLNSFKEEMRKMITTILTEQTKELKIITPTLKELQKTNENIQESITHLMAQNEDFRKQIVKLEGQVKEDKKCIAVLEERIEDLQRSGRKSNFEIKNVPKKNNETKEDLIDMVMTLAGNVNSQIDKKDISDIYRVRSKKDLTQNAPIIVETTSVIAKTDMLKSCKFFNIKNKTKLCAKHLGYRTNEDTPVYVSEQLTARGARLHFLARDLVKSRSYKFCWTAYGVVYVRKDETSPIIKIHSEAQIQHLMQAI